MSIYKNYGLVFLILALGILDFSFSTQHSIKSKISPNNNLIDITLPEGFQAKVIAKDLGYMRQIAVRDNGDIFVIGFKFLVLRDNDKDGSYEIQQTVSDTIKGGGLAIQGDYLYAATIHRIYRWKLLPNELLPNGAPEIVVDGFVRTPKHTIKTFTLDDNFIYVNIGAPSNVCHTKENENKKGAPVPDPCPQLENYAGVWRYPIHELNQKASAGYHFATGIRNAVAIDWDQKSQQLYAVQHGRDRLDDLHPHLFTSQQNADLPAEEFIQINDGDNFGWPYCYYDAFQKKKLLAPEYGGNGQKIGRCQDCKSPILGFPAHYSPNDLLFYQGQQFPIKYQGGAFVAFHGSWNRGKHGQRGFNVGFVPMNNGQTTGNWEIFADGFAGKPFLNAPQDATFRPCGLAEGPAGSLYILDSKKGNIWKVEYGH